MTATTRAGGFFPAWWFAAFYVVLLLCVPTRLVVGPFGAPGTPANLLAVAGLLWWICAVAGGLVPVKGLTPMRLAVGVFVAAVLTSYVAGQISGWSQPANIHQRTDRLWQAANVTQVTETVSSAADRGLLALAGWVGIMLITAEGIRSWHELDRLIGWIVGAGTVVASMGIVQYFTGLNLAVYLSVPGLQSLTDFGNALSRSDLNRIVSTSAHPIELGVAMASLTPLALHRSLHSRTLMAWIPTMLIGVAALMSVSRSAVVVAGVAFVVIFVGWPMRWRLQSLLALPVLALAGRAALPGLLGSIRSLFTGLADDPSITGRTDDYPLVFGLIGDRPLFGQGLFTFVPTIYRTVDNQGLVMLLELGVIGTVAFAWLFLTGQYMAWAPRLLRAEPRQEHLGLVISASLAGIVASYVTFDALSFRQVAGLTFLYLGLSGAVWFLTTSGATATTSPESARDPAAAALQREPGPPAR